MKQFLAIIRGGPASGKTTIAKTIRDEERNVVWLKVDNFKDFFADGDVKYIDDVDGSAIATLGFLLDRGYSVVMEKIFLNPATIPKAIEEARKRKVVVKVFQISCATATLQERDKNRAGVKEGFRKPLGDKVIEEMQKELLNSFYPGAIELDTEEMTVSQCVDTIKRSFN